jgi:hypothetical protein
MPADSLAQTDDLAPPLDSRCAIADGEAGPGERRVGPARPKPATDRLWVRSRVCGCLRLLADLALCYGPVKLPE